MRPGLTTYLMSALGGLTVLAAQAQAQLVFTAPLEGEVSPFRNQAVIGQAPAHLPVRLEVNGFPVDSGKVRPDGRFEFLGVQSPEGPVTYTVTLRYPNGRTAAATRSIHILGSPDSIVVELGSRELPADGQSVLPVCARVLDRWNVPIPEGYFITVAVDSFSIVGEDANPSEPGHQLRLLNGVVSFGLRAGWHAGPARLTLSTNGITARRRLDLRTPTVPLMMVMSADATGSALTSRGSLDRLAQGGDLTGGLHGRGRVAGFAKGTVFQDYLMTLSVDTDRKLQDRIFRDLDPNTLYSMYGDNSAVSYEAQSTSPLFAKLERDRSYLLYGDYHSLVTANEFSAYNRSFTGGKLHIEERRYSLDAFGTVTNRKAVQEEIRGQGLSGYYYLQQQNIVTGSERVRLEVRHRFHSEVVVTRKEKARYSDYEIDYIQGSLYFKQPVPSLDPQNNPVFIVVSYEAITTSANTVVAGGAGEITLFDQLTLGGTTVLEQREPKDYTLVGGNFRWHLERVATLHGEAARSSDAEAHGSAWKVEADISPRQLFSPRPYYRKVDGTFTNATQSGSGRELGTTKYGAAFDVQPLRGTAVAGEFYEQHQATGTLSTDIRSLSGSIQQTMGRVGDVLVKVEDVTYDGRNPEAPSQDLRTHSTLLTGTTRATIVTGLRASAGYEQNLRSAEKHVRPNAVNLGLEYQISEVVTLFAQQKFLSQEGRLTTVGVATTVDDQTSVYGRYELGSSIAGERNAATIGLKNSWKLSRSLTSNILYEKTKNLSRNLVEAQTPDHDAVSLAFEYLPEIPLRLTLKGEYNNDNASVRKGVNYGAAYRVLSDLSLVSKGTFFVAHSSGQAGQTRQSDNALGFAYRPARSDWLNIIGKVELRSQENNVVQPANSSRATIVSLHAYVEPVRRLEFGIKYAMKQSREEFAGVAASALTDFLLVRPQFDLMPRWNIAGEVRLLTQRSAGDLKVGCSLETGFVFVPNTMFSIGYNFRAYKERDLVDYAYSVHGPYATVRLKLTEDVFGPTASEQ